LGLTQLGGQFLHGFAPTSDEDEALASGSELPRELCAEPGRGAGDESGAVHGARLSHIRLVFYRFPR
jgi:hypothetical protein